MNGDLSLSADGSSWLGRREIRVMGIVFEYELSMKRNFCFKMTSSGFWKGWHRPTLSSDRVTWFCSVIEILHLISEQQWRPQTFTRASYFLTSNWHLKTAKNCVVVGKILCASRIQWPLRHSSSCSSNNTVLPRPITQSGKNRVKINSRLPAT